MIHSPVHNFLGHKGKTVIFILGSLFNPLAILILTGINKRVWFLPATMFAVAVGYGAFCDDGGTIQQLSYLEITISGLLAIYMITYSVGAWLLQKQYGIWFPILLTLLTTTTFFVSGMAGPYLVTEAVGIQELDPRLEGFRICQLSDIHLGGALGTNQQIGERIVRSLAHESCDLLVITGDLADGDPDDLGSQALPIMTKIPSTHGVMFVSGNHEELDPQRVLLWEIWMRKYGVRVLSNEMLTLHHQGAPLEVVGLEDRIGSSEDLEVPEKQASTRILLAHRPGEAILASRYMADLALCGHTHGGQIRPIGDVLMLAEGEPFSAGGMHTSNGIPIYVNPGTWLWGPPLRFMSHNEITILVLTRK